MPVSIWAQYHNNSSPLPIIVCECTVHCMATEDGTTAHSMLSNHSQVLDPLLDVRTVRYTVWKSGGDMKFTYRVKQSTPSPSPSPSTPSKSGDDPNDSETMDTS